MVLRTMIELLLDEADVILLLRILKHARDEANVSPGEADELIRCLESLCYNHGLETK
jgi:hypothetical protein